ncbi:helix-turn-helix domain-containing protein [Brachybacterium sp. AOP43-C2-M15]|uniref:helix-turn-helix domain-containing protein n=1 Tax=Brachybacterium sp. AOP43-C2-M15 TaxID=3457661 RepID=UPI0040348002
MSLRRIATPADLGALVRESRRAARLTQADLAAKVGVSREWLIGLERGSRPRAELTKVLAVLDALDMPLTIGRRPSATDERAEPEPSGTAASMSTAEVTRRAIAASLPTGNRPSQRALMVPKVDVASMLPRTDVDSILPKTDITSMLPKISPAALLSAVDSSVLAALDQGVMATAGSLVRASLETSTPDEEIDFEGDIDESAGVEDEPLHVDGESRGEDGPT